MLDSRAKLSQICARARDGAALLVGLCAACGGGGEETPYRERPAYRAFQERCRDNRQSCGPEGLCAQRCASDAEQDDCQLSCQPHHCLSNDWTHAACIRCCADEAHSDPDALSRCQRKCGELYEL